MSSWKATPVACTGPREDSEFAKLNLVSKLRTERSGERGERGMGRGSGERGESKRQASSEMDTRII